MEDSKWYMIKCMTNKEVKAIANLRSELEINGLESFVEELIIPKEKQYFMRGDKKVAREKMMFPGFILAKMKMTGELPRVIKRTNFIFEIMGNNGTPEALKQSEVDRIFGNEEKSKQEITYFKGEEVLITDGPFKSFEGVIEHINKEKNKVKVSVMIFGNPTPVELSFSQIDKPISV